MATIDDALASLESDPDARHIVSVSGGKDSAALAVYMREHYPQIPVEYVFCDTGTELPETYEYLERLEAVLDIEIKRLDAMDLLGVEKKPGRSAFDMWLEVFGNYLPNPQARWCTRVLKIKPFEQYVGESRAFSYIGIRGDEDREGYRGFEKKKPPKISDQPNILPVYPFKEDGLGIADIKGILEEAGIGQPDYYVWRSRSGCYFCFYQQIGEWQQLKEQHPDLFEKAKQYEKVVNGKKYTWVQGWSLEDIEKLEKKYPVAEAEEAEGCAVCHL